MTNGRVLWFRCFADVPGVGYPGDPQRRSRLPERDFVPELDRRISRREREPSLRWPASDDEYPSGSPVYRLASELDPAESSAQVRERVLSALELPGEVKDYHFALQGAAELLYKRRRQEPENLAFVEWLAWFNVRLVEAYHELFLTSHQGQTYYLQVFALGFLLKLHEREGYWHEALALAERFSRFRPHFDTPTELRARVAQLRAEHG
ncbi:MAG TPA: hypothetical protein VFS43_21170 [Polyangiaceae bacterium]|nr:hypothetical protein [Polyangiaceae bacterium]